MAGAAAALYLALQRCPVSALDFFLFLFFFVSLLEKHEHRALTAGRSGPRILPCTLISSGFFLENLLNLRLSIL